MARVGCGCKLLEYIEPKCFFGLQPMMRGIAGKGLRIGPIQQATSGRPWMPSPDCVPCYPRIRNNEAHVIESIAVRGIDATCRQRHGSARSYEPSRTHVARYLDSYSRADQDVPRALVGEPPSQHAQRRAGVMDASQRQQSNPARRDLVGAKISQRLGRHMVGSRRRRQGILWYLDIRPGRHQC